MIIIDAQATTKLIHALRATSAQEGEYALRFHRLPPQAAELRPPFIALLERYFPQSALYLCDDGEIFLLAHKAALKECRKALQEAAAMLGTGSMGELYELSIDNGALLILLEKKVESRRQAESAVVLRQAQEQALARAARRRQEMLELPPVKHDLHAQRKGRSSPELMVIEDDAFSRRLVENVLAKQYRLTALASAEAALSTYANQAPDLLFLDINLPDVTGHELLEKIIALDPDAYVVMLSGNADKTNVMQAMSRGARGFVAKPFAREKLFQYIERCNALRKEMA